MPGENIALIRYFSAPTNLNPLDPDAPARQAVYFRALETIPNLVIHKGRLARREKKGALLPLTQPPRIVSVEVFEEKRTDVNIASYMLLDAFARDHDTVAVLSNDSDLTTPVQLLVNDLKKTVICINPSRPKYQSSELRRAATRSIQTINARVLVASQFAETLSDGQGFFSRPPSWV